MKPKKLLSMAMAGLSLIISAGCATPAAKKKSVEETKAANLPAPKIIGTEYTTIVFRKGQSTLDSVSKKHLRELASNAHKSKKTIDEIRVLAWSDEEYPDKVSGKATTAEIILASERANAIKDYLEKDLQEMEDIDAYNMAKRPNLMSKMLQNDEYQVKEAFESTGTTGSRLPSGAISYTKASKAIVIIDYEGDDNTLK